jgi:hypothetical protein
MSDLSSHGIGHFLEVPRLERVSPISCEQRVTYQVRMYQARPNKALEADGARCVVEQRPLARQWDGQWDSSSERLRTAGTARHRLCG